MRILSIDIGGTAIKTAITDETGRIFSPAEFPSDGKLGGRLLMDRLFRIIEGYKVYDRIGISTAGQVDTKTGSIIFANDNIPGYTGTPVRSLTESRFHVPVAVGNDVNCAALGEAHYGAGKEFSDFLCLTYGTGIGGGIVFNRKIYGGSRGVAGEFGHIMTHINGLSCVCGQQGCYEQYASTTALVKQAMAVDPSLENGRLVFEAMRAGNKSINNVIDNWVEEIMLGLVILVHIFNPPCMILGGGIMNEDYILQKINQKVYGKMMESYRNVVFKKAVLGNNAGLLGASFFVLQI